MTDSIQLISKIRQWATELGFSQIGVAPIDLRTAEPGLQAWLDKGFHGDMQYMAAHGMRRARPAELVPGTVSVITARMDYLPSGTPQGWQAIELDRLGRPSEAIVSIYARGRDYHKVLRSRLQKLAQRIDAELGSEFEDHLGSASAAAQPNRSKYPKRLVHRAFTDSAPVLEVELATRSGLGWRGKHTLTLARGAGSMFFLGEIYVDLALPFTSSVNEPAADHCGSCTACIDVCPTQAIVSPGVLDARRCISYLTIEHVGAIPVEFRTLMGNRIYGCDDCQLVCPWNKFAQRSALPDFDERAGLTGQQLETLFAWTEEEFLKFTEGSPIRRIGHARWQRNIAVAMGNALKAAVLPCLPGPSHAAQADVQAKPFMVSTPEPITPAQQQRIRGALLSRLPHASPLVAEHISWALD